MRFFNIVPIFSDQTDYMISEAKRLYRECGITEPLLSMTLHPQGEPLEEKLETCRRTLRIMLNALKDTPVKVGVLFQTIIGHRVDSRCEVDWQQVVNINHTQAGRCCILDPDFRNYLAHIIRTIASEHPHYLMIDDDLRQIHGEGLECFCPRHMEQFNSGLEKKFTAEELMQAIKNANPGDSILQRFEELRKENMIGIARLIRSAIDEVDPNLPCGCCTPSGEFPVEKDIAFALAGSNPPLIRLCNGDYGVFDTREFPYIDYKSVFLRRMMKGVEDVIDEADTCPHNRYSKSAISLHSKLALAALNGETGAKLWLTNTKFPDAYTERKYDALLAKYKNYYPAIEKIIKNAEPHGFVTPLPSPEDLCKVWHPLRFTDCYYKICWQYQVLAHIGIPGCFDDVDGIGNRIALLTSDMLRFFDDTVLRKILSGKVLMDQQTAIALVERGFAAELGVKVVTEKYWTQYEQWHNGFSAAIPTVSSAPGMNGKYCEPDSPESIVLSRRYYKRFHHDQKPLDAGAGTILFDRRIMITAMSLKGRCCHPRISRLLKMQLETLLQGEIPLYVECDQNIFTKQFKLSDGSALLAVFNLSFDPQEGIELKGSLNFSSVEQLSPEGIWIPVSFRNGIVDLTLHTFEHSILKLK